MKKNGEIRLSVTDMNDLGYGIGHFDGKAVFVRGAVAGDEARVKIIKDRKTYCVGRCEELLTPSDRRVLPECRFFPACGGCAFRHASYAYEKELKAGFVASYLKKEGLSDLRVLPVLSTGQTSGYRNKVQFPYRDGRMGYFAGHSHRVVTDHRCALHHPAFAALLDELAAFFEKEKIEGYDETTGKGLLRHVVLRCGQNGKEILLTLVLTRADFPKTNELTALLSRHPAVRGLYYNINKENTNVIFGDRFLHILGEKTITDELLGCSFELSPASFYQVNHDACELLYRTVIDRAALTGGETVADLFCGVGTIGICMAKHTPLLKLIGVEIEEQAVENAKKNAERNGISNAEFICGDANHPALEKADAAVVDPPRKGLDEALIAQLSALPMLKKIVCVSCAPDTLARDLARFRARGWTIGDLQPVDMFPRTGHVESVVLMSRA